MGLPELFQSNLADLFRLDNVVASLQFAIDIYCWPLMNKKDPKVFLIGQVWQVLAIILAIYFDNIWMLLIAAMWIIRNTDNYLSWVRNDKSS